MAGGSRRRSNQWVIPLAVTATAAVATAALWWWTEHSEASRSPGEGLAYDSDYDPAEGGSPPGSTSASKSRSGKSKRKEAMEGTGKKKEKLPDVREETESEREKKIRSQVKDKEKSVGVSQFKRKQEESSGYASGYASEGGRSRSVNGGVLSRSSLVSQDEIKRYVPPIRKRSVCLVLAERDLGRNPSDDQIYQVQRSSLLSFLRPPLINDATTTLFFLLHTPPSCTSTPIATQAASLMPPTYPTEFFLPYEVQPDGLINMLRGMEPQIVYVEQSLCGDHGELIEDLLDKSWVGYVTVVLDGKRGELEGLVDTEDEDTAREDGGKRWWEKKGGVCDKYRGRCSVVERAHLEDDWRKRILDRS